MKKENRRKYKAQSSLFFWLISILVLAIVVFLIIISCIFLSEDNWKSILSSVTKDLFTAVLVTFIIGAFFKMITEKYFLVRRNDKLLMKFGVSNVGTGKSTIKDIHSIFGYDFLNIYPQEIHMQFITGNIFLNMFKKELIDCLKHGCIVKILLVSTEGKNANYVRHLEEIYRLPEKEFNKEMDRVKDLIVELKIKYHDKIKLRFYQNEYFYNFRSATYFDKKKDVVVYKSNINIQPFNKPAVDCSIGLSGTYKNTDKNLENNIFYLNDQTFNILWDKYADTEYLNNQ